MAVSEARLRSSAVSGAQSTRLALPEAEIIQVFGEVLGKDDVQADDDFFDLGGDSFGAVTVMAFIEQHFGVSLPVSTILEAPTPRALAKFVAEASRKNLASCIIRVQETGAGSPLFIVHGIAGEVGLSRLIAAALGPTRPVYGMRALGLRAGEQPISGIPEIAAHYVAEMRTVQPTGPYLVHGYCGGVFIAFEMAQQLRRANQEVKGLIMVDPPLDWRRSPFLVTASIWLEVLKLAASARYHWGRLRLFFRGVETDRDRRVLVARTLWRSLALYEPEPYPGEALMIYCRQSRDIILKARSRGIQKLMPNAVFRECGKTHGSLFQRDAPALAATKDFIERLDPPQDRVGDDPPAHTEQARMEHRIEAATR